MDGLAEAFIDWTRGQSKDTQFGVKKKKNPKNLPKPFSGQTQQASYNKVIIRYPAVPSPGATIPSLFSMTSCRATFDREKSHSSPRLAV